MKNRKFAIISAIVCLIIIGMIFLLIRLNNNGMKQWYSPIIDVTDIHTIYTETNETKTLQELEEKLQSKKISYKIENKKLDTGIFSYNIVDQDAVVISKDNELFKKFDYIDQRDLSKVKVSVDYKEGKKNEVIKYGDLELKNGKYYIHNYETIGAYASIIFIIFIYVFAFNILKRRNR